jgi:hypothetical protein
MAAAAPPHQLIADLSTMAAVGCALAGGVGRPSFAMVPPMLMHAYTDAAAAGQALIATQFATVLQVVWRAIWQFLDAILFGGLLARKSDGSSAKIISADPPVAGACRCGSCCAVGFVVGDEVLGWTLRPASADRRRKAGFGLRGTERCRATKCQVL